MKSFIIDNYENQNLNEFRGVWKNRSHTIANDLNYVIGHDTAKNVWASIVVEIKEKQTNERQQQRVDSTAPSTSTNRIITQADKTEVLALYQAIKEKDKGALSTGKKISDCMHSLAKDSIYEHPVHSFTFDTSDPI